MRVLVTGAGRGLGLELVVEALARGWSVAATARDPVHADLLRGLEVDFDGRLTIAELDVADSEGLGDAVAAAVAPLGGLDLLVNSAGVNAMSLPGARGTIALDSLTADPFLEVVRVNTLGPILVARAALPALRGSDRPRIVNVSSWLGSIGTADGRSGNYAYAASKAALNMCTRLLAGELRDEGVTVVAVNPGWMRTAMGGARAELSPAESARGILDVAWGLVPEDSGRFLQWDGTEHPW